MNNIFTTLLYQMEKHHDTVLCTIIADNGSTPRGRGAQMLVGQAGLLCGTIGGGAVEGQTIELGKKLCRSAAAPSTSTGSTGTRWRISAWSAAAM